MQNRFRTALVLWITSLAWGLVVVGLLPDDLLGAQSIFRLSDEHGPTLVDLLGIVPAVAATPFYLWHVWQSKKRLSGSGWVLVGVWALASALAILAASANLTVLLVVSIALAIGSLLLLGIQVARGRD